MNVIPFTNASGQRVAPRVRIATDCPEIAARPAELLDRALADLGERASARILFDSWPLLRRASLSLASHLTLALPGERAPLLVETLAAAFAAQREQARRAVNGCLPAGCFVEQLVACAPQLAARSVRIDDTRAPPPARRARGDAARARPVRYWNPLAESLQAFAAAAGSGRLVIEANRQAVRMRATAAPQLLMAALLGAHDCDVVASFLLERSAL